MIECIFTLDYEIYGDGTGSLGELVYEPTKQLANLLQRHGARCVVFVEVAELSRIEKFDADPTIGLVKEQVRSLHRAGFEIGLHFHPWWYNACRRDGKWLLDYSEYNLCTLPAARVTVIVSEAIHYLRHLVDDPDFTPFSFRAGNWLFQPTEPAATIVAHAGVRVDSSVFLGGRRHDHGLDYRRIPQGQYFWQFSSDVTVADPRGTLIEIPIHSQIVPFWRMHAARRLACGNIFGGGGRGPIGALTRVRDFLRVNYPLKLDFCRASAKQMMAMVQTVLEKDRKEPEIYRPIVAIGHSKDLSDIGEVNAFLAFLGANRIALSTFREIYPKLLQTLKQAALTDDSEVVPAPYR